MNLFEKLVASHLISGEMKEGSEISIRIDQTLTQDALGTMAYLQFEAMGIGRVLTELSASYVDHLTLQQGYENADDQKYLKTVASKYGIVFSKAGNGICHQIHLERMSRPGHTLIGSDSHTCTCGAVGMLAIGAGGLDVAVAMAGGPFYMIYPRVLHVSLHGVLQPWVTAKDLSLHLLSILTTQGNVGSVIEYGGPAVCSLSIPERATLTNMGAELGITTSIFPSDRVTRNFFRAQGREEQWMPLGPDPGAVYDQTMEINLSRIEPNLAWPHSPDHVSTVREAEGIAVDQVLIGSCTNASFKDLMTVAVLVRGKKAHSDVSFGVAPGSRQVLRMIAANGALGTIIESGARILESACGFCAGYGQSPNSGAVSLRTSNRNFQGRCGTMDARVFLASPETAVAAALTGKITDPRNMKTNLPRIRQPKHFFVDDSLLINPSFQGKVFRGPNIGDPPRNTPMPSNLEVTVAVKLGDKISTDHILPAGSASRYRANIPKSSELVFQNVAPRFPETCERIKAAGRSPVIVAGESYGQGSSREHAALCPMYLGVRAVLAKSIERIHRANLINFGIVPLMFTNNEDYEKIQTGDLLEVLDMRSGLEDPELSVFNKTQQYVFIVSHGLTPRQREIVMLGGLINSLHQQKETSQ